jgi:23S rRNA (cytosine1962-C5)-methyltransferase
VLPELGALLTELGYLGGYLKQRVRSDLRKEDAKELAPEGPWFGVAAPKELVVVENGMKIGVDLSDGLSSGLFLDQRDNRLRARHFAGAGRVLNLFSYTCSFSVSTALAGAKTVSVDLSGRALERGKRNFELNELPLSGHSFLKEDAMKYLARAQRRGEKFNFIVLDPPSFATVGKGTFSVAGRYEEAAEACLRLLAPGGRLLAVTNHEKTSLGAFRKMLQNAGRKAGLSEISLKSPGLGLDCPPAAYGPFPSKSLVVSVP